MLFTIRRTAALCACLMGTTGCPSGQVDQGGAGSGDAGSSAAIAGAGGQGPTAGAAGTVAAAGAAGGQTSASAGTGGASGSGVWNDPTFPTCGASTVAAQEVVVEEEVEVQTQVVTTKPVALYIMLDKSGSMGLNGLWTPAVNAVKNFVAADSSSGLGVALQYFPADPKVTNECSTGAGYYTPAVDVATLPAAASGINTSLDNHSPVSLAKATTFGTPMEGALRGVTEFCKTYQANHTDTQCVGVLVTDGVPEYRSDCDTSSTNLAKILSDAYAAGVTTFAVGLQGSDFTLLDKLAKAGGAPKCDAASTKYACDVSSDASKLEDALASIREKIVTTETHTEIVKQVQSKPLPCEWTIPTPTDDTTFDPSLVNVRLTAGELKETLVHSSSKDACRDNAWYFDDESAPTRMIACPTVCSTIEAAGTDAKVDILLGCPTIGPD